MAQGRKLNLANSNVAAIPLTDEPQSKHIDTAAKIKKLVYLTDDESAIWDIRAPYLVMLGRLKPHFADAFAEYCRIINRLTEAREYLDKDDWTYVTSGRNGTQYKSRPEVAQLNDDWRKWRSMVGEFGLAPASERGMQSGQADLFDDFDSY